ncbi:MAG: transcription termination/antitermination protein NusG [Flavobacteriaceae bacterium]
MRSKPSRSAPQGAAARSTDRWYVVHTHPHREPNAARHLAYQDFGVFLPQRFRTRRHARRMDTVLTAYFPCYLFVQFDIGRDRWRAVNGTHGVRHLIMRGNVPDPVPDGLVETLVARTDGAGILCLRDDLRDGEQVQVTGGPFADLIGTLDGLTASDRVRVLLDILGGSHVTLPRNRVAPVLR